MTNILTTILIISASFCIILSSLVVSNKLFYKFEGHNLPYLTAQNFVYFNNSYKILTLLVNCALLWVAYKYRKTLSLKIGFNSKHARVLLFFICYNLVYPFSSSSFSSPSPLLSPLHIERPSQLTYF